MKASFCSAVFAVLFAIMPRASEAATISCVNSQSLSACSRIWISGELLPGDSDSFAVAVRQAGPYLKGVLLSSAGGSPQEAMKIGEIISARGLSTQAPVTVAGQGMLNAGKTLCKGDTCVCASACFLIWAAGTEKSGDKLGIHRPVFEVSRGNDTASGLYWKSTMMPRMLALSGNLRSYLAALSVPEKFIERITHSSTTEMYWLTQNEALAMAGKPEIQQAPVQQQAPAAQPVATQLLSQQAPAKPVQLAANF